MRSAKLSLVLRHLRDHGPRSRARLAAELDLPRSAVSALVGDLEELGLVRRAGIERGNLGRPGTAVELDGSTVCGIGADQRQPHRHHRAGPGRGRGRRAPGRPRRAPAHGPRGPRPSRRAGHADRGRRPRHRPPGRRVRGGGRRPARPHA
ncbi:MAG: MarR family transcriptional regulator [Nocardioides sp.]|nr:MarR family transcriptional regulator [Nocardioidaceae bacterium]MCB8957502.1 MarR family transcriptional regulator [Nocardioides sp.]